MFLAFAVTCKLIWGAPAGFMLVMLRDLEICFELLETRMIYYHWHIFQRDHLRENTEKWQPFSSACRVVQYYSLIHSGNRQRCKVLSLQYLKKTTTKHNTSIKNIDLSPLGRRISALVPNSYKLRRPLPKIYSWDVNGILPLEQEQLRSVKTTYTFGHTGLN